MYTDRVQASLALPGAATVGKYALIRELRARGTPAYVARSEGGELVIVERLGAAGTGARAKELLRLHHPNVARVREVAEAQGFDHLVTDYVPGASLADVVRAAGADRVPLEAHLRTLIDLLNGLSALHGHVSASRAPLKLVHGSVSPHAAYVGFDGSTRLSWLGRSPS